MYGWRGKIGFISPAGDCVYYPEFQAILPEDVAMTITTLGVEKFVAEDFQKTFSMYPAAVKGLAAQKCDVIHAGGALGFVFVGWERSQKMIDEIRRVTTVPVTTDFDCHFTALKALSAKRIIMVSPYEQGRNEERKKVFEEAGFEVVNMKGLGIVQRLEVDNQPAFASYRLAKQAFLENPRADAMMIVCPGWPTVRNIEKLEYDLGIPVVSHASGCVWHWLKLMNIKGPVKGFGRLFDLL